MLIDDNDDVQNSDDKATPTVDNPGEAGEMPTNVPAPEEKPFNESETNPDVANTTE